MLPHVSFIIPCFNERHYVASCLASVSQQQADPASFETIVVDNGSLDGTRELAASYHWPEVMPFASALFTFSFSW